jgi:hypothetical protein
MAFCEKAREMTVRRRRDSRSSKTVQTLHVHTVGSSITAGQAAILPEHVSEAVNYRMLDRQFWS